VEEGDYVFPVVCFGCTKHLGLCASKKCLSAQYMVLNSFAVVAFNQECINGKWRIAMDALLCCIASDSHLHFTYMPMISQNTPTGRL
jgi:hypothetical protein